MSALLANNDDAELIKNLILILAVRITWNVSAEFIGSLGQFWAPRPSLADSFVTKVYFVGFYKMVALITIFNKMI